MSGEALAHFRAAAAHPDSVLLEGFHALKHALRFGAVIRSAVCARRDLVRGLAADLAPDLWERLEAELAEIGEAGLRALSPRPPATGVIAIAARPHTDPDGLRQVAAPILFLDRPTHLGNIGAVIRSAAAAGAAGIVTSGQYDPWAPAALRGSAGLHFALPVLQATTPPDLDLPLLAFDAAGERLPRRLPDRCILAFGGERRGLSPEVRARADRLLALPMRPGVSSLNLAAAAAVALYLWRVGRDGA